MIYKTNYDGYFVDDLGTVYSNFKKGGQGSKQIALRKLSPKVDKDGYLEYGLSILGVTKYVRGHRLVYESIVGAIPKGYTIDHINHIKNDNRLVNLQILSIADNTKKSTSEKVIIILDNISYNFNSNKEAYEWLGISESSYFKYKKGKIPYIKKYKERKLEILGSATTIETIPIM